MLVRNLVFTQCAQVFPRAGTRVVVPPDGGPSDSRKNLSKQRRSTPQWDMMRLNINGARNFAQLHFITATKQVRLTWMSLGW